MKAEDLMIGDWVYLISTIHNVSFPDNGVIQDEGYTTTHTPIKTTTVSENCASYYSNKLELYITVSSEDIEPIPLTPEILEKNGFEDRGYGEYYYFADEKHIRIDLRSSEEYYMFTDNAWLLQAHNQEFESIGSIELTYVHELQHFLKSCKLDIIIVL